MPNSIRSVFALLGLRGLFLPQQSRAQTEKEFEKELQEANQSLYQDAEKAVKLGTYVNKNAKQTDEKIIARVTLLNWYQYTLSIVDNKFGEG